MTLDRKGVIMQTIGIARNKSFCFGQLTTTKKTTEYKL